jgi:hypothetical protein
MMWRQGKIVDTENTLLSWSVGLLYNVYRYPKGFSSSLAPMFPSTRQCTELMPLLYWLKIRFTLGGQRSNIRQFCVLYKPILLEGFFSNLDQMFTLACQFADFVPLLCQLKVKLALQGQMSNIRQFHVCSINPVPPEGFSSNFAQIFASKRQCA